MIEIVPGIQIVAIAGESHRPTEEGACATCTGCGMLSNSQTNRDTNVSKE